jgi:predicted dehydrogenase/acetyltransferase-like isoleucine patch superfamily enzyme
MRIAVIGCGYWGKNIVRNMSEIGALAAVCDGNPELAATMAQTYSVPAKSFDDILADSTIDGVAIAAPATLHYDLAKSALLAGKDVFVEKPLALDLREAQELCTIADRNERILMVGHLLQYHPAYLTLKQLVADGALGTLNYIYSNRLNLGKIRREENILWSFAPHDISMILGLVGEAPSKVKAVGSAHLQDHIADVTTTHMTFPGGVQAHIFVSWLHPFKEQKLVVVGDKAMAVFDDGQDWGNKLVLYPHKVNWQEGIPTVEKADANPVPLAVSEPLKDECRHFVDCIRTRAIPRTDGMEGCRVLDVLQKATHDLEKSMPVPDVMIHESAYVDQPSTIGAGTKIWHFSHILANTTIGEKVVIGQNCVIGPDVTVGNRCKIQNNVSLYKGVTLEDGVFCGPSCVFTNVNNPRAEIERKNEYKPTLVRRGATIGANATIVCGHTLGEYSFIAAGAVVTCDVPAYALMAGVPARQIGWMSRAGGKLGPDLICPIDGTRYEEKDGVLSPAADIKKEAAHG